MERQRLTNPRRFVLVRGEDVSGVSGVGIVAQGCDFGTKAILYWQGTFQTLGVYDGIEELLAIHGHEGRTWIEWLDVQEGHCPKTHWWINAVRAMIRRVRNGNQKR